MKKSDIELSNSLYVMKGLLLLSIICAHSAYTQLPNPSAVSLFRYFSATGVFGFFVLAGYFFNYDISEIKLYVRRKIVYMIIPWGCLGLATYAIRFKTLPFYFNPLEIANWLLGNGTYLWFLSVLLICEVVFVLLPLGVRSVVAYICIVLTIVSVVLTSAGVLPISIDVNILAFTGYNVYLNIFNWIGMFALGIILKKIDGLKQLSSIFGTTVSRVMLLLFGMAIFGAVSVLFPNDSGYWAPFSLLTESIAFVMFFLVSFWLKDWKSLIEIGKITLPIYILHAPVVVLLNKLYATSMIFTAIRPALVVVVLFLCLEAGLFISRKLGVASIFRVVMGIK